MSDQRTLTLHQVDHARADFAAIDDDLKFVMGQLAELPTRAYLCRALLLASASVWALIAVLLLMH
jgi:hypothetical protein